MEWQTDYALGDGRIDADHREFVRLVDAMLSAADIAALDRCLDAFAVHAKAHFEEEDRLMAVSRYDNARCHVDEHRAVLASVEQVRAQPEAQRVANAYRLAVELARWFPGHVDVMDRGMVDWAIRHRTGGAPLKFLPKTQIEASAAG